MPAAKRASLDIVDREAVGRPAAGRARAAADRARPSIKGAPKTDGSKADGPIADLLLLKRADGAVEKRIRGGFAWDLFLFAPLFGLPLFLRRLPRWGSAVLGLWLADLAVGWLVGGTHAAATVQIVLFAAFLLLQLWLGFKGNALTARAYLAQGWTIDRPDSATRRLMERWGLQE